MQKTGTIFTYFKRDSNEFLTGFTLIELIVTIAVFTIIISSVVALFASALRTQDEVFFQNEVLSSSSYAVEYMAKALRMAKKDLTGGCITAKSNFENIGSNQKIRFLNYEKKCQEFGLANGVVYVKKSTSGLSSQLSVEIPLTSSNLNVSKLGFIITGNDQEDELQPKVTFLIEAGKTGKKLLPLKIQTTVSQRDLDIPR